MTPQQLIRLAYNDCLRLSQAHMSGWNNYLEQAFEAAQIGERQHRKGHPGRCKVSVLDAARYFAAKWFLDQTKGPESWTAALVTALRLLGKAIEHTLNVVERLEARTQ
jgi:hypothetical protein